MKRNVTCGIYPLLAVILSLALLLSACASAPQTVRLPEIPAMHSIGEVQDEYLAQSQDPWVGFNKNMYKFNFYMDKYALLPVVSGYEFITPDFVQERISCFFNNLREVRNITNNIFQLKGKHTLKSLSRFVVNSSIGIGGLFDPATELGLEERREDFGQTLGYWGAAPGPYLILPLVGPSNVRDTSGFVVDTSIQMAIKFAIDPFSGVDNSWLIDGGMTMLEGIDKRHLTKFRYHDSSYPFEYEMLRYLYGKKREIEIRQ